MNKLFIIILVVLLCSVALLFLLAASDPEWIQVDAKSKNSSVHSYLPSSLKGSKRIRYLWLKVIYNDESLGKVFDHNKIYINAYSHTFLRVTIDCKKNSYAPLEEHNKSAKGYTLASFELLEPRQFIKIFPQTAEDSWKNFACTNNHAERMVITLKTLFKNIYQ